MCGIIFLLLLIGIVFLGAFVGVCMGAESLLGDAGILLVLFALLSGIIYLLAGYWAKRKGHK